MSIGPILAQTPVAQTARVPRMIGDAREILVSDRARAVVHAATGILLSDTCDVVSTPTPGKMPPWSVISEIIETFDKVSPTSDISPEQIAAIFAKYDFSPLSSYDPNNLIDVFKPPKADGATVDVTA